VPSVEIFPQIPAVEIRGIVAERIHKKRRLERWNRFIRLSFKADILKEKDVFTDVGDHK
jgi:hypothetical protein